MDSITFEREFPILFSAPMVRAILDGRKTQTRRVVKPQPNVVHAIYNDASIATNLLFRKCDQRIHCPYGQPGNRLWVRETWARDDEDGAVMFRADCGLGGDADDWQRGINDGAPRYRWRPSIHLPRWASRILLEVIAVRVERLQDISEADALTEGVTFSVPVKPSRAERMARDAYAELWESINGTGSWDANPWVWVIEFKRVQGGAA